MGKGGSLPREGVESKGGGLLRVRVKFGGQITTIFQQLDPGERRAKRHVTPPPVSRFTRDSQKSSDS